MVVENYICCHKFALMPEATNIGILVYAKMEHNSVSARLRQLICDDKKYSYRCKSVFEETCIALSMRQTVHFAGTTVCVAATMELWPRRPEWPEEADERQ